ncbi:MAG: plasmid replication protein RepC [Paracoccaceae bacterium]
MDVLTTTPFGRRPVTAALVEQARAAQAAPEIPHINKWELFRELCTAKAAFGVTDRELTVLNALLSFHPEATLSDNGNLIVFPSNAALSERAHGMAESTLRRHLAGLVQAGLIRRHDSPNGKRYAARGADGEVTRAFGFDLRPLLEQGRAIVSAAAEARAAADRLRRLREEVTLMKRDAVKLAVYGEEARPHPAWEALQARLLEVHKRLRRNLAYQAVEEIRAELVDILRDIRVHLSAETEEMSGSDAETERHYQNSNEDSHDFELRQEKGEGSGVAPAAEPEGQGESGADEPRLPLALVLKAAPDILPYAGDDIRSWHELVAAAGFVRGMMGISPDAWRCAQEAMGPVTAAITLACMLQRVSEIRSPGGYLRALTTKAGQGAFSPGPMVMALLNSGARAA